MEAAIAESTVTGLTKMQELGLAGIFLSFLLIGAGLAVWYFARHCERRTSLATEAFQAEAAQNRAVIEKNTSAFQGVQIALVELRGKVER